MRFLISIIVTFFTLIYDRLTPLFVIFNYNIKFLYKKNFKSKKLKEKKSFSVQ